MVRKSRFSEYESIALPQYIFVQFNINFFINVCFHSVNQSETLGLVPANTFLLGWRTPSSALWCGCEYKLSFGNVRKFHAAEHRTISQALGHRGLEAGLDCSVIAAQGLRGKRDRDIAIIKRAWLATIMTPREMLVYIYIYVRMCVCVCACVCFLLACSPLSLSPLSSYRSRAKGSGTGHQASFRARQR